MPMDASRQARRWLVSPCARPNAEVRLVCIPYAGGGVSAYWPWAGALSDWIEVIAVRLPGREVRLREPPFRDMRPLIRELTAVLEVQLDRPFAVFGHSMGALIAFELTRELRRRALPLPAVLFVSGRNAPQVIERDDPIHLLPDEDLIRRLRALNGTSEELLQHEEIMRYLLPLIRADLAVNDTYQYVEESPFDLPIAVLGGDRDPEIDAAGLEAWRAHTRGPFQIRILHGDHFYIHHAVESLAGTITEQLSLQRSTEPSPSFQGRSDFSRGLAAAQPCRNSTSSVGEPPGEVVRPLAVGGSQRRFPRSH